MRRSFDRKRSLGKARQRQQNRQQQSGGQSERAAVAAPFDERRPAGQRKQAAVELSQLVTRIATYVICRVLVDDEEALADDRLSVAHAFVQRATTTHICNHKLTDEGLVFEFQGELYPLHEEYKTMALTRTVYEHLAMFYFLYVHPKTQDERDVVWKYWQLNSKKNLLDYGGDADSLPADEQQPVQEEIGLLRRDILASPIGAKCRAKLEEWTRTNSRPHNGSIEIIEDNGKWDVRKISYSQAWKHLFKNKEMALLYRHLSMHCHPVSTGLELYQNQATAEEGNDAVALHLSSCFLAYLCHLFLKLVPGGDAIISAEFSEQEQRLFRALFLLPGE